MRQIYISLTIFDFVPLAPLSMPVSCHLCCVPRRFRATVPLYTPVSCCLCRSCRVPRQFRAARPAFHADFVPLVPFVPLKLRSLAARAAPPCRWRCVSRRFRDARAVRAALSCRLCRIININIIVNILSCFAPKPLLHVILRTTSD